VTGPEHYQAAERLATTAAGIMDFEHGFYSGMSTEERLRRRLALTAEAQVHATLALAAATALAHYGNLPARDDEAWYDTAGTLA
jgi:hypothetical protein